MPMLLGPKALLRDASKRVALVGTMSCVLALGAALGPAEGEAFAAPTKQDPKAAPGAEPASEEDAKTEGETTDEAKKAEEPMADAPKKELDTSVESAKAVYFSGDFAFTRSDLGGISDNTGFDRTVANGLLYGLSAGLRLRDVRFGARWRVYDTTESTLWTLALSAGYGLPFRPVSPVFSAHVGYVFDQHIEEGLFRRSIPPGALLPPNIDMRGLLVGLDVNASYWVTQFLRLGAFIGADLMFLHRSQATLPRSIVAVPAEYESDPLYTGSGSSIGLNVNIGLRGAFDIAFQ
ncbi:MAG: acid shock protein [Labilithrix sp.]|nr:acid shock protein [Labilithrix sp.]